jgi:predicted regulator of Ras-like GTPase activity (Roadblock/LC7/MglB family)/Flp pilus assembly protein TadD
MGLLGIFGGIFKGEKAKLEEALENNPRPSPEVFTRLIRIYREEGQEQKALRVAKRGAALYPDAMDISQAQEDLARIERDLEKERLRQKIESYPNPILYGRLAELYKADGEIDRAIKICEAGIRQFPEYGGTHLVLGQITYDRGDLEAASSHLERAVELDKYNYPGLKLLSECYLQLDRAKDAVTRLKDILNFAPGDEAIIALLKKAREQAGDVDDGHAAGEIEARRASQRTAAASVAGGRTRSARAAVASHEEMLNNSLEGFAEITGVKGALVVDHYGRVIASRLPDGEDEELTGALVTNVYRTTVQSGRELQIGDFQDGLIEGDTANVHIIAAEEMILAVFAEATVKMGLLQKAIRDFVMAARDIA